MSVPSEADWERLTERQLRFRVGDPVLWAETTGGPARSALVKFIAIDVDGTPLYFVGPEGTEWAVMREENELAFDYFYKYEPVGFD